MSKYEFDEGFTFARETLEKFLDRIAGEPVEYLAGVREALIQGTTEEALWWLNPKQ